MAVEPQKGGEFKGHATLVFFSQEVLVFMLKPQVVFTNIRGHRQLFQYGGAFVCRFED